MKDCTICGEQIPDNAIRCSKGHSLFKVSKEKKGDFSSEAKMIREMLQVSSYSEEEISGLIPEIINLCREANSPITRELVERIKKNIEERKKLRAEEERRGQQEREERERLQREVEKRQQAEYDRRRRTRYEMGKLSYRNELTNARLAIAELDERYSQRFLGEHLRNANLQRQGSTSPSAPDQEFHSNEEFWATVLHQRYPILRWVLLNNFQIVDWFPRAPGLYHVDSAEEARREAEHYVREENGIWFYEPRGKRHMMDGGIGSVRFKPITIEGIECWLCSATSDMFCHSGIPLAIPNYLMEQIGFDFSQTFRITGQVRFLPEFLERHFYHMEKLPQIYMRVDTIEKLKDRREPVRVTPIIFFTSDSVEHLEQRANVSYVTCRSDTLEELDRAADWLSHYVSRYGGEIVTNYDQQRPPFQNAPFSLENVMTGNIDLSRLHEFNIQDAVIICDSIRKVHVEAMTMSKTEVKLGDGTTIFGDFVVANSIRDSFNKVASSDIPGDQKELLVKLAKEVGKMCEALPKEIAEQATRDLETLTVEATSKSPRKQWLELSVEGLKQAARNVGAIGKPVLELVALIIPLLKP